jgi:hypothetical protein
MVTLSLANATRVVIMAVAPKGTLAAYLPTRREQAGRLCDRQGSADGIAQCQQYYAHHPELWPPPPITYRKTNGGGSNIDPQTRAASIGVLLCRAAHVALPVHVPFYPTQISQSHSFTSSRISSITNCH